MPAKPWRSLQSSRTGHVLHLLHMTHLTRPVGRRVAVPLNRQRAVGPLRTQSGGWRAGPPKCARHRVEALEQEA